MKDYIKAILYAYPLLNTAEKAYEEHIKNKALLSYNGRENSERLMEYIAGEILEREKLTWLRWKVEDVLQRLSEEERALVDVRYFRRLKNVQAFIKEANEENGERLSLRTYFRRQERLYEKLSAMLNASGITEERYEEDYAEIGLFKRMDKLIEKSESVKQKKAAE